MGSEDFWAKRLRAGGTPSPNPGAAPPPNHGGLYGQQPVYQAPQQQPTPIGYTVDGQPIYPPPGQQAVYDQQGRFLGYQATVGGVTLSQSPQSVPGLPGAPGVPPDDAVLPMMDAIAMRTATQYKPRATDDGLCPECGSNQFFARSGQKVFSKALSMMVGPAPECWNCGYAGSNRSTEQAGSLHGALGGAGGAIKVEGQPRMARGAQTLAQAATQSGQANLYAPK